VALLAALKPTPPLAVLLLFDADRLGREQFETSYLCKQLDLAGGMGSLADAVARRLHG